MQMPAADTNLVRSWADFLQRLIGEKPGAKRKLESSDLQLDWKPLWRVLQKEIWPKKTDAYSSRNMINLFLYVAERCHRFYPVDEIPAMLEAFTPQFTQEVGRRRSFHSLN
jgi:proteasome activator subunit 4